MIRELLKKHPIVKEAIWYGIIGVISAGIDSLLFAFLRTISLNLYFANFISTNVGITCSFFLNTYVNFKISDSIWKRALSFFAVGYCGLGLSMLILHLGVTIYGLNDIIVKVCSVFIVAAFQFVLNKMITFRGKRHG